jgi:hypothetical protein
LRLPRTPFLGCPSFSYPTLIFYRNPSPLPHLAIYCCNLLTSKMLHNRPHLGQGGSPGSPPSTWQDPVGPGAEGSLSVPHPLLASPCLPWWGAPGWALAHLQIPRGGGEGMGFIAVLFNWNWKRDHVLFYALLCPSQRGEGTPRSHSCTGHRRCHSSY